MMLVVLSTVDFFFAENTSTTFAFTTGTILDVSSSITFVSIPNSLAISRKALPLLSWSSSKLATTIFSNCFSDLIIFENT